jgi:hypothetical protein
MYIRRTDATPSYKYVYMYICLHICIQICIYTDIDIYMYVVLFYVLSLSLSLPLSLSLSFCSSSRVAYLYPQISAFMYILMDGCIHIYIGYIQTYISHVYNDAPLHRGHAFRWLRQLSSNRRLLWSLNGLRSARFGAARGAHHATHDNVFCKKRLSKKTHCVHFPEWPSAQPES